MHSDTGAQSRIPAHWQNRLPTLYNLNVSDSQHVHHNATKTRGTTQAAGNSKLSNGEFLGVSGRCFVRQTHLNRAQHRETHSFTLGKLPGRHAGQVQRLSPQNPAQNTQRNSHWGRHGCLTLVGRTLASSLPHHVKESTKLHTIPFKNWECPTR